MRVEGSVTFANRGGTDTNADGIVEPEECEECVGKRGVNESGARAAGHAE